MSSLKGTGYLGACEYLIRKFGPECIDRIKAALTPADQEIFAKPIMPVTWLDYGAYMRFMMMADKVFGTGDMQIVKNASVFEAKKDLSGIYRIFLSLTSPQFVLNNVPRIWKQYYNRGTVIAEQVTERSGRWRIIDFPDIPLYHELDQIPFAEEGLRLAGAQNPVGTHPQCVARGDEACIFEFKWEWKKPAVPPQAKA